MMGDLSRNDITAIAEEAAKKAVADMLTALGIDARDPIAAQRDFMVLREVGKLILDPEFRKDLEHTRDWRLSIQAMKSKGFLAAAATITGGIIALAGLGAREALSTFIGK